MGEFEIIQEKNGKYTWRFIQSGNYKILARSFDEYDCIESVEFDIMVIKEQAKSSNLREKVKKYFQETGNNMKKKRISFFS